MSDICVICDTELVDINFCYNKIEVRPDGKIAVIDTVCAWCVDDIQRNIDKIKEFLTV